MTRHYDPDLKHWSILTKSQGGVVSVVRDLTLTEARQIYERLDPWYGCTMTQRKDADGNTYGSSSSRVVHDGDIELREVFGPTGWGREEVLRWGGEWPKLKYNP